MSINLDAPYAIPEVGVILKNPIVSNTEALDSIITSHRTMNGILHTYKSTTGDSRIVYDFKAVPRVKLLELLDFFQIYNSEKIKLTDFNGDEWEVFIEEESLTAVMQQYSTLQNQIPEEGEFKITFIGDNKNATSNYQIFLSSNLEVTDNSNGPLLDEGLFSSVSVGSIISVNMGLFNSIESTVSISDELTYSFNNNRNPSNNINIGQQLQCTYINVSTDVSHLITLTQSILPLQGAF